DDRDPAGDGKDYEQQKNNRHDDNERDRGDAVPLIERRVKLVAGVNRIAVELRGRAGRSLTVTIVAPAPSSGDTTPPVISTTVSPAPNTRGWNNTNVTVTFVCSDAGSGVAQCPPHPVPESGEPKQTLTR